MTGTIVSAFRSIVLTAIAIVLPITMVHAEEPYTEAHALVDSSTRTLKQFNSQENMQAFRDLATRARAIMIIPQMLRGGLVVGGTGGSGILLARDMKTGEWNGPAFYSIASITFGLQVGAEASQVVMVILTDKGLNSMLSSSFKLGADITMAAGPIGAGTKAATADILAYSISKGAFGGFTVEGAVMQTKDGWNQGYYGTPVTPADILLVSEVKNNHADSIREIITKMAMPTTKKVQY